MSLVFAYPLGVLELVVNRIFGLLQVSLDQCSNKRCWKEVQSSTSLKVHHLMTYFRIHDYYVHFFTPRWVDNGVTTKMSNFFVQCLKVQLSLCPRKKSPQRKCPTNVQLFNQKTPMFVRPSVRRPQSLTIWHIMCRIRRVRPSVRRPQGWFLSVFNQTTPMFVRPSVRRSKA